MPVGANRIVVCGEALYDLFLGSESGDALELEGRPGGSPFNVAVGLARLGQPVDFLGGLSRDFLGTRLAAMLAREGVDLRYARRRDALTTVSLVDLTGPTPAYAFYGTQTADRLLTDADMPALPESVAAIHIGSFSALVEPIGGALERFAARYGATRLVAWDINARLSVEPDVAVWHRKLEALLPHVRLIKMSDEDFASLYPGADLEIGARRWISQGVELVVVTRGPQGASAFSRATQIDVAGVSASLVDTLGAGDSFQAALLCRLAERGRLRGGALADMAADELAGVLDFACRAAAITCGRRGADPPRRAELGA